MDDNMVKLSGIVKCFGELEVVKGINLDIKKGEFLTLLGPSGCGKTTTLRMIAGFEDPTEGKIFIDGKDVSSKHPYERDVNTVFQSYALFPHMNLFNNIAFGLKIKKLPKAEIEKKVSKVLQLVKLEGYESRFPSQLSGGQKQRIAMARAIVNNPKVLLLDEPLGALDLKLRKAMQYELKHLQRKLGITFIYVTHDQEEALTMSDRIAIMNGGVIEQIGLPEEIYERPETKFVADFIGETNMFDGEIDSIDGEEACLTIEDGEKILVKSEKLKKGKMQIGDSVLITIRPEKLKLSLKKEASKNNIEAMIKERIYVGSTNKTVVTLENGRELVVNEPITSNNSFTNTGDKIFVNWEYENGVVI